MTELIKRTSIIDPSLKDIKTDVSECIVALDSFCTTVAYINDNKVSSLEIFDHKTKDITSFNEVDLTLFNFFSSSFKSITLLCSSSKETLIPTSVFDKAYLEDYIKFNFQSIENEVVLFDEIKALDIIHVYTINQLFLSTLKKIAPHAIIRNQKSVLIEKFYKHNGTMSNVYVNTKQDCFDCIIFNDKGLQFVSTFFYKTAPDYIYFLMNVIKQLALNPETINLMLSGQIEKGDAIYNLIYVYIRNINFIQKPIEIELTLSDMPYHEFFTVI